MRRIVLDTDLAMLDPAIIPNAEGDVDDGFALALALADPQLQLDLITTVNGNTDVDSATLLTMELLDRLKRADIPVYKGAGAPLLTPHLRPRAPDELVRALGFRHPEAEHGAIALARHVMENPGEITVVAIGPLTNIALAMALEPGFAAAAAEIVVMGGVFLGSTGSSSMPGEFNIWVDPEAAQAVVDSGARVRFVGLDVTDRVRLDTTHAEVMRTSGRPFAEFAGAATLAWIEHCRQRTAEPSTAATSTALHDPLAVAVVTLPDLVTWQPAHVRFMGSDSLARGYAVTDLLGSAGSPQPNCCIATDVDVERFMNNFLNSITSL